MGSGGLQNLLGCFRDFGRCQKISESFQEEFFEFSVGFNGVTESFMGVVSEVAARRVADALQVA